jgi:TPR repeat protein
MFNFASGGDVALWLLAMVMVAGGPPPLVVTAGTGGTSVEAPQYREFRNMASGRCNKGDLEMCFQLGRFMQKGIGGTVDERGAQRLFVKACRGHVSAACYQLNPDLIHVDERRSAELGCRDGQQSFCYNLAGMLRFGIGGPKDPVRAERLFEAACHKGYASACKSVTH